MSLLRLTSRTRQPSRSTARLKSVQQTFRPAPPSLLLLEQQKRRFASTPQHSDAASSSSSNNDNSSLSRSQPKATTASTIPPASSRDQQQPTGTQSTAPPHPASSGPESRAEGAGTGGDEPFYTADNYIKPTLHVYNTFRKLIVYTSAASVSIALLVFLGFEGTHLYVENVSIKPTPGAGGDDEEEGQGGEDAIWGWAVESQESWTGGKRGGTDPALGYRARHLIRAAWMAQNWGAGVGGPLQQQRHGNNAKSDGSTFNVTAYMASAQFLSQAIALAQQNPRISFPSTSSDSSSPSLSDSALDLLFLHSRVLERIGTPGSITAARDDLLQIWDHGLSKSLANHHLHHRPIDAARVALKIGDLSYRLQDEEVAVGWWKKAIDYATLGGSSSSGRGVDQQRATSTPQLDSTHVPATLPPSPLAQRILVSALVSLSTFFSATQQLPEAESIQRSALRLLSLSSSFSQRLPSSPDLSSKEAQSLITRDNAPAALHALFLQHRASVLSVHLAQVLYAASTSAPPPKRSWMSSKSTGSSSSDGVASAQIQLHSAATAAERVAHTLTGAPKAYSGTSSALTHKLSSIYVGDKVLSKPAASLLRDARRTAAEAWNLSGMLYQLDGQKEDLGRALECFERAVHWSGGQTSAADPESQVIQREWATYWKNYSSLKEKLAKA
ncbi:hypothetical protein FRC04_003004 [Tulasnella sp. 424]|nr:hypothetical protein FRC04_003004 [Tulasnella sp. 424]KAG8981195.1 hypothetical protein FRC05_004096 [Tulasnella sp. 425]